MVQNSKGPKPSSHLCALGTLQLHTGTLVLVSCISFQYFVYLQANVSQTFLSEKILVLAWASITKYHRLGGINNRNLFPHHSGGWVTVLQGGIWWELSSCFADGVLSVSSCRGNRVIEVFGVPSYKNAHPTASSPLTWSYLNIITLPRTHFK